MSIKCQEVIKFFEDYAPSQLAEDWDNVGLLVGSREKEINRILVCLDVTAKVVEEAVSKKADLIVSHHPLIFKGVKRITEDSQQGKLLHQLIKNDIGVYSAHTNLDMTTGGINEYLADLFELQDVTNLKEYRSEKLFKIVVFVPEEKLDEVREAMSRAGAGWIGNYSDCTFMTKGTGTFKPLEGTNPYIGSLGSLEKAEEYRLETIVPQDRLSKVIDAMTAVHPYEEVAYDVYPLEIKGKQYGMGKVGSLSAPQTIENVIAMVKEKLHLNQIRVIGSIGREVKKVAVFSGSFDEGLLGTVRQKADILVTGDIKYHTALEIVDTGMCVIEAGHFGTEHIMVQRLVELLSDKFSTIEVICNTVETDPFIFC